MFVNQYCTLDVSFGCENVTGKARTAETEQHGRQHPDGQYDCADEPDDRKRLLSASDYRDSRPVGATNELILEIGSLPQGVDWKKLLAFIDTNMSVTVMKNGENQSQSLKPLMRRKLTIYVLRKSDVWLMEVCWNTLAHGTKVLISHLNPSHISGKMPQDVRVKMDMPQLVTMFSVNIRIIFTFDRVSIM
ncbi:hypothetical protein T06_790 [Trichinella sp. T6]|nr:hypothetical protein T06_790 [Trichinella sp. T6]